MKDWISLFEKYKIDRRLLDSYRTELSTLPDNSTRARPIVEAIEQLEIKLRFIEDLLDSYDNSPASPREAVRRSEERLYLTYRYVRGMTMEAIAEEMKISRDTVYRIRRRILARDDAPNAYPEPEWKPLCFPPKDSQTAYSRTAL